MHTIEVASINGGQICIKACHIGCSELFRETTTSLNQIKTYLPPPHLSFMSSTLETVRSSKTLLNTILLYYRSPRSDFRVVQNGDQETYHSNKPLSYWRFPEVFAPTHSLKRKKATFDLLLQKQHIRKYASIFKPWENRKPPTPPNLSPRIAEICIFGFNPTLMADSNGVLQIRKRVLRI